MWNFGHRSSESVVRVHTEGIEDPQSNGWMVGEIETCGFEISIGTGVEGVKE